MDCAEARRRLGGATDPFDAALLAHLRDCARCAAALVGDATFERALADALAVPVPVGLAPRILAAQRREPAVLARPRAPRRWLALAAAAVLALALGIAHWRDAHSLAAQATAHVTRGHEVDALRAGPPLPRERVSAAFAAHGLHLLAPPPAAVAYIAGCEVGGSDGLHMVMDSPDGPVSVLYLRGRKVDACVDFRRDGLVGRIVPVADGALVLLAHDDHAFAAIEAAWRAALEGPRIAAREVPATAVAPLAAAEPLAR